MGLCVCMYAIVYTCVAKCYMWGSCGFVEDNMFDSHPEDITWSYVDSYIRAIYTWVDKIVSTEQKKHNFFSFKLRERDYFPAIGILYLLWDSDMDSPVSTQWSVLDGDGVCCLLKQHVTFTLHCGQQFRGAHRGMVTVETCGDVTWLKIMPKEPKSRRDVNDLEWSTWLLILKDLSAGYGNSHGSDLGEVLTQSTSVMADRLSPLSSSWLLWHALKFWCGDNCSWSIISVGLW